MPVFWKQDESKLHFDAICCG